jgi:hypothetical protein
LPKALPVSIALKYDPAWDKKGQAWVDVRKRYQRSWKKFSSHSVNIVLSSNAQQKPPSRANNLANCRVLLKTTTTGVRQTSSG